MMVGDKQKYNVMLVTLKCKGATGEAPGTDQLDGPALKIGTARPCPATRCLAKF